MTVRQGVNYARQIEQEYIGAKAEYGSVASTLGIFIIPAGASALALGAEGVSATAVTGLGVGTAALLGEGYWLTNKPREKVYMTGASALECLIDTMEPFDEQQTDFPKLRTFVDDMADTRADLNDRAHNLEKNLAQVKTAIQNSQDALNPNVAPVLCYVEKALKASNGSGQAESKAYDAAVKYDQFSQNLAGKNTVDVANRINDMVSAAMIDNEPDLHTLASNLSSAIPTSAQSLAQISTAKSAVTAAATATQKVAINAPAALKVSSTGAGGGGGGGGKAGKGAKPLNAWTINELNQLIDQSASLQKTGSWLNSQTETVVDLTPDAIRPRTESCTNLFDQPGSPPDLLTLNPSGYLPLKQGDDLSVAISGGKVPYDVRLMCDCYGKGITATTQYESGKATIKISASGDARAGTYPLMVVDATGVGRPLVLAVPDPSKTDYSDEPDCAPITADTGAASEAGQSGKNIVAAIIAALKATVVADQNAAKFAKQGSDTATKAQASNDVNKIVGYLSSATAASSNTSKYAKSARTSATRVAGLVAAANDPTLTVYRDAAQKAADDASTHEQAVGDAVKQIAHHLSMVVGK